MINLTAGGMAARLATTPQEADGPMGLFANDTRLARVVAWTVSGEACAVSTVRQHGSGATLTAIPQTKRNEPAPFLTEQVFELDGTGLTGDLHLRSLIGAPQQLTVELSVTLDMADQFELRMDESSFPPHTRSLGTTDVGPHAIAVTTHLARGLETWQTTAVLETPGADLYHSQESNEIVCRAEWVVELPPHRRMSVHFRLAQPDRHQTPRVEAASPAGEGLARLITPAPGSGLPILAAGAPWFLTLFGRDSLWSAFLARHQFPALLDSTMRALALFQGRVSDPTRQEEPGKIVHEVRSGGFAALDLVPFARYYGGVDTTPLWLMMLACCSPETIEDLREPARAATEWLLGPSGLSANGFVTYSADPHGLVHQGWKDSSDAILTDTGEPATQEVALVEVQGYTYAALRNMGRLASDIWHDDPLAARCHHAAESLRERFLLRFVQGQPFPVMATANGVPITTTSSNPGHLLVTGILDRDTAHAVATRLLEPDMFTGYGIRTLTSEAVAYSPASYHRGSVWPHDTAVAMVGMRLHGLHEQAHTVARGLKKLEQDLDGRVPEFVMGLSADEHMAVAPAQAAFPQAWAAAALLAAERVIEEGQNERW